MGEGSEDVLVKVQAWLRTSSAAASLKQKQPIEKQLISYKWKQPVAFCHDFIENKVTSEF